MQIRTIAECVENGAILEAMRDIGVNRSGRDMALKPRAFSQPDLFNDVRGYKKRNIA